MAKVKRCAESLRAFVEPICLTATGGQVQKTERETPMNITDEQITKFQFMYRQRFGKQISREEAYEQGVKLIRFMEVVCRPITAEENAKQTQLTGSGKPD
jgi:hypothetical protein